MGTLGLADVTDAPSADDPELEQLRAELTHLGVSDRFVRLFADDADELRAARDRMIGWLLTTSGPSR